MAEIQLREDDYIISKTDLNGKIIYGNDIFITMSGYNAIELKDSPHSIIRHPDMPKVVFKLLWDRIKNKQEIFAFVKNKCKNGDYYWVFTNVSPTIRNGQIIDYHSVRRKPNPNAIEAISKLYTTLIQKEKSIGLQASEKYLNEILNEKGVSYDEFIRDLQG